MLINNVSGDNNAPLLPKNSKCNFFKIFVICSIILSITAITVVICLIYVHKSSHQTNNYDSNKALNLWNFCIASYCSTPNIQNWNLPFTSTNMSDVDVIYNSSGNSCGYTAYDAKDDKILVVFRGTQPLSLKNWMEDISTLFTTYEKCEFCEVHSGFYSTYLQIRDPILTSVQKQFVNHPTSKITVTGHSLGAALATFACIDITLKFKDVNEFYTFGCPRVGNGNFSEFANNVIKSEFNSRITHQRDPVPLLPLNRWGFQHMDTEIHYKNESDYIICSHGEDENCSLQNGENFWMPDHWTYMGVDLVPHLLSCAL